MALNQLEANSKLWYPFDMRMLKGQSTPLNVPGAEGIVTRMRFMGRIWFPARSGSKTIDALGFKTSSVAGGVGENPNLDISLTSETVSNHLMRILTFDDLGDSFLWAAGDELTVNYAERLDVNFDWIGDPGDWSGAQAQVYAYQLAERGFGSALPRVDYDEFEGSNIKCNAMLPQVVFGFDDGTYGTLDGATAFSSDSTLSFGPSSEPNEYGLQFTIPWDVKVDALCMFGNTRGDAETRTTSMHLYQDGVELDDIEIDEAETVDDTSTGLLILPFTQEITLERNLTTIISLKPNNLAQDASFGYLVPEAANIIPLLGPAGMGQVSRGASGIWSSISTTAIPKFGMRISSYNGGAVPVSNKEWLRYYRMYSGGAA